MNLSKKSSFITVLLLCIALVGFGVYKYAMKPPATIESKQVDYTGTATNFINKAQENSGNWRNKIVVLDGVITAIDPNKGITLNQQIYCQFKGNQKKTNLQEKIKIKGRFMGYDDLLDEIKLDECIILD